MLSEHFKIIAEFIRPRDTLPCTLCVAIQGSMAYIAQPASARREAILAPFIMSGARGTSSPTNVKGQATTDLPILGSSSRDAWTVCAIWAKLLRSTSRTVPSSELPAALHHTKFTGSCPTNIED